jgi:hypothetical protein
MKDSRKKPAPIARRGGPRSRRERGSETLIGPAREAKQRLRVVMEIDVPDNDTYYRDNFNKECVEIAQDWPNRWKDAEVVLLTTEEIQR